MKPNPTNTDDMIDIRDVIERVEELETLAEDNELDVDDKQELETLKALAKEVSQYAPDWGYDETLIRDTYFTQYAEELAEDCGMINDEATWPNNHIDWESAAKELKIDYTVIYFDGVKYWIR